MRLERHIWFISGPNHDVGSQTADKEISPRTCENDYRESRSIRKSCKNHKGRCKSDAVKRQLFHWPDRSVEYPTMCRSKAGLGLDSWVQILPRHVAH